MNRDKTESPFFSVIIPVYNNEKTIEKCVDSILLQSYENFELILVNDGSTDSTPEICDRYAGADNRIHVIHMGENKGWPQREMKVCSGLWEGISAMWTATTG